MKKTLLVISTTLLLGQLFGQVDRSSAPEPAPAKAIEIGAYQTFTLKNGLQVFVVENHKLPRIQFSLQLKNDPPLEHDKAGYMDITGTLMGTGTTTRTKAQIDEDVDFIGAVLSTSSDGMVALSLTKHVDKLLELASDILLHPTFPQDELDKLKTQTISSLEAARDSPGFIAGNVRGVLDYGQQHPYGEITTTETVSAVTADDCRKYYETYFKPNNAYLAIVGDIDLKKARSLTEKYFGSWASGNVTNPSYAKPAAPLETYVAFVDRPASVQSVINITYPVDIYPGSPDAIKSNVLNEILGGGFSSRLIQNLREDKGYTYGARSSLQSDHLIGSFTASASVRNAVTDSAVHEFMYELKRIVDEPVTDTELQAAKAAISGRFGRALESPQTVASFALNTARYNLSRDYYSNYLKNVDAVTKADIQAAAKKYIRPDRAYILVVGKATDVAEKLNQFGKIRYYDMNGNAVDPSRKATLPAGLTAEKVIGNYLEALGGLDKVKAIRSVKMMLHANAGGTELNMNITQVAPDKSRLELIANGQVFQKLIVNGKKVVVEAMGSRAPVEDPMQELQAFDNLMFRELGYKTAGATALLKGIEQVDGRDAYVVEFALPLGQKTNEYYDVATGLKIQTLVTVEGPQGEASVTTRLDDYKEVEGIKFPSRISQSQGQMRLDFEMTGIELNGEVTDEVFKIE